MKYLIMLAPLTLGCLGYYHSYAVGIVGFDPTQTAVIVDAARRWETACNGDLRLTVKLSCDFDHGTDICIQPKRLPQNLAITDRPFGFLDDPPMRIYIDTIGYVWTNGALSHVAQHELGHAFGLNHTGPGTVMYRWSETNKTTQTVGGAQDVTCADVAQFDSLRGVSLNCSEAK
jgi:hypothetical protein